MADEERTPPTADEILHAKRGDVALPLGERAFFMGCGEAFTKVGGQWHAVPMTAVNGRSAP